MPFNIVRNDITKIKVDAIVNATNTDLKMGGGVSGAIFKVAGSKDLQEFCDKLAPIKTGQAVITPGFNLPAKFIIHAAGPVYGNWTEAESEQHLRNAYFNALKLAVDNNLETIAFPLISSGIFGFPKEAAIKVATSTINDFLLESEIDVTLVVYDSESFVIGDKLHGAIDSYIDDHYIESQGYDRRNLEIVSNLQEEFARVISPIAKRSREELDAYPMEMPLPLEDIIGSLDEPFSDMLLRLIDKKGLLDVTVYKQANLSRKLFSKIRSSKGYMPSKRTAIALAIALKLSLPETEAFLKRAGFALSHAVKFDVIIEYFIVNEKYDIFEINEVLFKYDQPLLGG